MVCLQKSSTYAALSFFRDQLCQQFHSCFLNSTNAVGYFISGINGQFYNYKESFDKKKSIFDLWSFRERFLIQCTVYRVQTVDDYSDYSL